MVWIPGHCSISPVKRFRSDRGSAGIRYRVATGLALLFALAPLGVSIAPSVVTTDLFIVSEDEPIAEDVYVAATSGRVEGRVDGDLVIDEGTLRRLIVVQPGDELAGGQPATLAVGYLDDDAVDLRALPPKQLGIFAGIREGFHGAVRCCVLR